MRGVVALILFALLASLTFGIYSSIEARNGQMRDAIALAAEQKRTFYTAKDLEDTFWQTVRIAVRKTSDSCQKGCTLLLEETLKRDLGNWQDFAEHYPNQEVSVVSGWLDRATLELKSESPVEEFPMVVFEVPEEGFRIFTVYVVETPEANGIFAKVNGNSTSTLALIPAGSSWSCAAPITQLPKLDLPFC